jgi:hypothetical protein
MPGFIKVKARWKNTKRVRGSMNRLERKYAFRLEQMKERGEIVDFRFEAMKLRLADLTYLTPDFAVLTLDGFIELHEVKGGFFPEHNRVKLKVAVEQFPWFTWRLAKAKRVKDGGGWTIEEL